MKKKNKMNIQEVDKLLERYYEGSTNVTEEKLLKTFLNRQDLPERFNADRAIFGYFGKQKQKHHTVLFPFIKWAGMAAALVVALFCIKALIVTDQTNYAFIDGNKTTDMNVVKAEALTSLQIMASAPDEVLVSISHLNDNELVEQQLSLFSEIK